MTVCFQHSFNDYFVGFCSNHVTVNLSKATKKNAAAVFREVAWSYLTWSFVIGSN